MKLLVAGVTLLLLSAPVRAQEQRSVDEILSRVGVSMRVLLAKLPEFVCTETITSSRCLGRVSHRSDRRRTVLAAGSSTCRSGWCRTTERRTGRRAGGYVTNHLPFGSLPFLV